MAKKKTANKGSIKKKSDAPGVSLEKVVARIQQDDGPKFDRDSQ